LAPAGAPPTVVGVEPLPAADETRVKSFKALAKAIGEPQLEDTSIAVLNALGAQGWGSVGVETHTIPGKGLTLVWSWTFKRPG
jgi:hypothetical protein